MENGGSFFSTFRRKIGCFAIFCASICGRSNFWNSSTAFLFLRIHLKSPSRSLSHFIRPSLMLGLSPRQTSTANPPSKGIFLEDSCIIIRRPCYYDTIEICVDLVFPSGFDFRNRLIWLFISLFCCFGIFLLTDFFPHDRLFCPPDLAEKIKIANY